MACLSLALAFGCDERDPDIMLMDGGGGTDSGSTTPDSGSPMVDAGGDGCPPQSASAPTMPMACQASTLTCLMGATTQAAQQACIDADPNAMNCGNCITEDVYYTCTMPSAGCDEPFGEVLCCIAAECGSSPTQACAMTALGGACMAVNNTFGMCLNSAQMARSCGVTNACFMSGGAPFLPDFGRGPVSFTPDQSWMYQAIVRGLAAR